MHRARKAMGLAPLFLGLMFLPGACMTRQPAAPVQAPAAPAQAPASITAAPVPPAQRPEQRPEQREEQMSGQNQKIQKSDAEWQSQLSPEQFQVLRRKGTERAFTGAYWNEHRKGVYLCAACGQELFRSDEKFDSGTGWPSFSAPAQARVVETETDESHGMRRVEVHCSRCGGHLGHVFEDGPRPTGTRYCINSVSLKFQEK